MNTFIEMNSECEKVFSEIVKIIEENFGLGANGPSQFSIEDDDAYYSAHVFYWKPSGTPTKVVLKAKVIGHSVDVFEILPNSIMFSNRGVASTVFTEEVEKFVDSWIDGAILIAVKRLNILKTISEKFLEKKATFAELRLAVKES